MRVGINGFGRMGRLALRAGWGRPGIEFVHVNEIATDAAGSAHLLKFDSVQGRWSHDTAGAEDRLTIDGLDLGYSSEPDFRAVDWTAAEVDLVIEATGGFRTLEKLQPYLDGGVKRVVVAAPVPGALNVVMGVNHGLYDPARHTIVTAASCTTNCLAPVVKVMHETLGIRHGTMTTIHDITNTQTIVDKGHKDWRRARAAGESLIPTTTGSAKAIGDIFPELNGKLNGLAVRVPLLNASLVDFVFEAWRPTDVETVNNAFEQAAAGELAGILGYETLPLVSVDYRGDTRSSIVDAASTLVIDDTQVKVLAWYDNETGYVNRLVELVALVAAHGV